PVLAPDRRRLQARRVFVSPRHQPETNRRGELLQLLAAARLDDSFRGMWVAWLGSSEADRGSRTMNGHAFTRGLGRAAGIVVIAAGAAAAQQQQQGAAQWGPIQGQVYENQLQEALEADRTRLRQVRVPVTPARAPLPLG